eukprot:TRINITY_DN43513_c0_g1_i1.p1 TRINITY_DN43513_c0_g1~~TRINITY_DN43513_c0_g1_i1.p1  ORF type:complete len:462 (+),score=114.79 TRINITY_DN43513_c0_g1_i1:80-1465(+)
MSKRNDTRFLALNGGEEFLGLQALLREESLAGCVDVIARQDDAKVADVDGAAFVLCHRLPPDLGGVEWSRAEDNRLRHLRGSPALSREEEGEMLRLQRGFDEFERAGVEAMGKTMRVVHYVVWAPYGLLFCINPSLLPHKARQRVTAAGALPLLGSDGDVGDTADWPAEWRAAWCVPVDEIVATAREAAGTLQNSQSALPPPQRSWSPDSDDSPTTSGADQKKKKRAAGGTVIGGLTASFAKVIGASREQLTFALAPRERVVTPTRDVSVVPPAWGEFSYDSLLRVASEPAVLVAVAGKPVNTSVEADAAFAKSAPYSRGAPPPPPVPVVLAPGLECVGPVVFPRGTADGFFTALLDVSDGLRRIPDGSGLWCTDSYASLRRPPELARWPSGCAGLPQWDSVGPARTDSAAGASACEADAPTNAPEAGADTEPSPAAAGAADVAATAPTPVSAHADPGGVS